MVDLGFGAKTEASLRRHFVQAAAPRTVQDSRPPAGVLSKRRPLEKSMLRLLPLAFLRSGDRSKSPRFKSPRARCFQAAAARKVNASSPPAGVSSKRRPLEESTVQVSPRAFFQSGGRSKSPRFKSHRGLFSKRRPLKKSTVQVSPRAAEPSDKHAPPRRHAAEAPATTAERLARLRREAND